MGGEGSEKECGNGRGECFSGGRRGESRIENEKGRIWMYGFWRRIG